MPGSLGVKWKTYRFVLKLMEQEPYKKELQLSHILIPDPWRETNWLKLCKLLLCKLGLKKPHITMQTVQSFSTSP